MPSRFREHSPLRRRIIGILGLLLFVLAAVSVYVWLVPLHISWVNARVVRGLEQASGVPVRMQDATLRVFQGIYKIRNLSFHGTGDVGAPGLTVAEVDVDLSTLAMLTGQTKFIDSVVVHAPSELELLYDHHGVELGPRAAFLGKALRNYRPRGATAGYSFREVRMTGASVRLVHRKVSDEVSVLPMAAGEDAMVRGLELSARSSGPQEINTEFQGLLSAGGHESVFAGGVRIDGENTEFWINSPRMQVGTNPKQLEANRIDCRLQFQPSEAGYIGNARVSAEDLTLTSPRQRLGIADRMLALNFGFTYEPGNSALHIENASAASEQLDAHATGTVALALPHAFDGSVQATRMGPGYEQLLGTFLPAGYRVDSQPESFSLDVAGAGDAAGLNSLIGKLNFTTVTIGIPTSNEPLRDVTGELDFEPGRLVFHQLSGRLGDGRVGIHGSFVGDYLRAARGRLLLDWSFSAGAAEIAQMQSRSQSLRIQPVGQIEGEGTFQQDVTLRAGPPSGDPILTGTVKMQGVALEHPKLKGGLTDVSGELRLSIDRLLINNLTAKIPNGDIRVSGEVAGERRFWVQPVARVSARGTFDVDQLLGVLPEQQRYALVPYHLKGIADCDLRIDSTLAPGAVPRFTGKVTLRDGSFDPNHKAMRGVFSGVNGTATWDGNTLVVNDLRAMLNNEPISGNIRIGAEEMHATLNCSADLAAVQAIFPAVERMYDLSGNAACNVVARTTAPPVSTAPAMGLIEMLGSVPQRITEARTAGAYELAGEIEFGRDGRGANIRHHGMPAARRDEAGREVPRGEIRNAFGKMRIARDVFTIPSAQPVRCEFADTKNCRLSGQIQLRPNEFPRVDFLLNVEGEARLDPWLFGWGKEMAARAIPPPPDSRKTFDVIGRVSTRSTYYRGVRAGALNTNVKFTSTQNAPPRITEITNVRLQGWGGSLGANFRIESFPRNTGLPTPRWRGDVDIRQMQMLPLLACVFRDVRNIDGVITAQLSVGGTARDTRTLNGQGSAAMSGLQLSRTPLIQRLGETTQRNFGGMLFETASSTSFRIGNGAISSNDLRLQTNGLLLEMNGSYYFDKRIDAMMRLNFFTTVLGEIPLLGELANLADQAVGKVLLSFRVSGSADNPRIQPVPFALFQGAEIIGAPR